MKVALFVPCYVDAFFPEVAIATLELLERLGVEVDYPARPDLLRPADGQQRLPGRRRAVEALFVTNFAGFEHVVTPSGSCVHHVRQHLDAIPQTDEVARCASDLRAGRVPARRAGRGRVPVGRSSRTGSGCTTAAARCAGLATRQSELEPPLQAAGAAVEVRGHPVREPEPPGRVLRLRRHVLGRRGAGVGAHGLRQGEGPPGRRRRVHRLGRHVVPDAPAGLRRAHGLDLPFMHIAQILNGARA